MIGIVFAAIGAVLLSIADSGKKALTKNFHPLTVAAITIGIAGVAMWLFVFAYGVPQVEWQSVWWRVLVCAAAGLVSEMCFLFGVKDTDFSLAMPLLAFMPVFGLAFGYVLFGEVPSAGAGVGVLLVVLGAYFVGVKSPWRQNLLSPLRLLARDPGCRRMLVAGFSAAFVFSFQQPAVQKSSSIFFYACYLAVHAIAFNVLQLAILKKSALSEVRRAPVLIVGTSLCWLIALGLIFASWTLTLKAYSASIMQLQLLVSILIGKFFFKEQHFRQRILAGLLMLAGCNIILWCNLK